MAETMYARICAVIVCLGPYKVTFFFFVGGCYRNLDPSGDVFSYAQVNLWVGDCIIFFL